jgi:pyruvate dehydrogenase E2 component (dihydrolipoamide acetyltransferase)
MEAGIILKWLKKEGDQVEWGEVIAEVETDKAVIELEVYETGVLRKIVVPEGSQVPVGDLIAIIGEPDEDISMLLKEAPSPEPAEEAKAEETEPAEAAEEAEELAKEEAPETKAKLEEKRILASPLARSLAQARGVNLRLIKGSGPAGRIVKKDVEKFLAAKEMPGVGAQEYEEVPLTLMRKTIARRMTESKTTVPHFYITVEVNMGLILELRERVNQAEPDLKVSINDVILKAVAKELTRYPQVNASFAGDVYRMNQSINLGSAVAVKDGLITPVIRECDKKSLAEIARESRDLVARARDKKLKPEEYSGATFTVTNLGMYDVDNFAAIILPPEGAILAVGSITAKPVVDGEQVKVGQIAKLTMSCDHRVIDGALAAKFLSELKATLENPWRLLL